ncbi:phage holin family protein [Utexia brackfieldae]|uniref:phage holin family protein n=1 Tax=Utexia brackfieldae TaxID=3074108 RepID=UPI00370D73AC
MKIIKMPQNNTPELAAFLAWLKSNASMYVCVLMAFAISYLMALREDIATGNRRRGKLLNSLILSLIALPFALGVKELLLIFFRYESDNIPMLVGLFIGFWGIEKMNILINGLLDLTTKALERVFERFLGKK